VEVGGPRPGQAGDDDRGGDLDVSDLGMAGQLPLDAQPVAQELHQQRVLGHHAHGAQLDVGGQRPAEHRQALLEDAVAEVVEALRLHGQRRQLAGLEAQLGGHRRDRVEDLLDVWRERRGGEVVEDDIGRAVGHGAPPFHAIMADLCGSP
jgi:hypothetical protein